MKFEVGDRVRYNREALIRAIQTGSDCSYTGIRGFEIIKIADEKVNSEDGFWFVESDLELVPEELEFEYGEEIEVRHTEKEEYTKRYFITKISIGDIDGYLCYKTKTIYLKHLDVQLWAYARKLKPKLSRKEIAERFKVSEEFILVD